MNSWINLTFGCLLASAVYLAAPAGCLAQIDRQLDFRIDSAMHTDGSASPVSRNKTIFSDGLIFDFPVAAGASAPDEILVYDSHKKSISLLDQKRQVQLTLLDVQVEKLLNGMREQMKMDDRSKLMLEQTFKERIDLKSNAVTLTGSQNMTYRFFGKPPANPHVLPAYFEFLNVFTRVQASDPKKFPPFARMRLNESIRKVGWLPDRVEVKISPSDFFRQPFKAHTTHQLSLELSAGDREEIALAKRNWAAFPAVSLMEYRNLKTKPSFFARVAQTAKENSEAKSTEKR